MYSILIVQSLFTVTLQILLFVNRLQFVYFRRFNLFLRFLHHVLKRADYNLLC